MAVRSKEEILDAIKARVGEATDDDSISFIEDVTDTLSDYETRVSDQTDWKKKYEENDTSWRTRYRERFFSKEKEEPDIDEPEEPEEKKKIDDLFKEE